MTQIPQAPVAIRPIGVVVSDFKDFSQKTDYYTAESTIVIREDLEPGLMGLEHFSHIHVLYHQHRRKDWQQSVGWADSDEQILTMPLAGEPTCKGIYTSRAPARPSGIGSCVAELLRKEGNRLTVRGLDAFSGTAILDIKIYIPKYDCFPQAVAPLHWCQSHPLAITSQMFHWDTMSVSLTLGMRAGLKALQALGISKSDTATAEVIGGNFFAQGIEGVTGCSVLRGTMAFQEKIKPMSEWMLCLVSGDRAVTIRIHDRLFSGPDEVLRVKDEVLFADVALDGLEIFAPIGGNGHGA